MVSQSSLFFYSINNSSDFDTAVWSEWVIGYIGNNYSWNGGGQEGDVYLGRGGERESVKRGNCCGFIDVKMEGSGKKTVFSVKKNDYKLMEEVGYGASATVYRAIYLPLKEVVAVKCLDLERCNSNLNDVQREAQTMSLIDHPNLISAFCSFVVEHFLWVVMPFMAEGSCLHLMKIARQDGFDEPIVASILKETLKGLEYLHRHGHIHRDVKAGNILLNSGGIVKLGDFGVTACMFDKGDRQRARNTFVGTPCWMAPEVLQQGSGYDFKADIWSFGITALELAHGHAPFSKHPPMKVLLMTIQNGPPGLDYDRDKRFSKSFKEMVAMCLVKDPTKRPTAEKLLKHSFFKSAKLPEVTVKGILAGLAPLWDRVKELQLKDAAQLASRKMPSAEQEALSQSEYKRGVSAWNFDVEDLKIQASLIQEDEEDHPVIKEMEGNLNEKVPLTSELMTGKLVLRDNADCRSTTTNGIKIPETRGLNTQKEIVEMDLPSISIQGKNKVCKLRRLRSDFSSNLRKDTESNHSESDMARKSQPHSGPIAPVDMLVHSISDKGQTADRFDGENQLGSDKYKGDIRKAPSLSGPLILPNRASANSLSAPTPSKSSGGYRDLSDEKSKVQIKGRFSVTSENVDIVKDVPICAVPRRSSQEVTGGRLPASILVPHLQNLYQQTSFQLDLIMNLMNSLQQAERAHGTSSLAVNPEDGLLIEPGASDREQLLLLKISEMQARVSTLTDELTAAKVMQVQLQQQLSDAYSQGDRR